MRRLPCSWVSISRRRSRSTSKAPPPDLSRAARLPSACAGLSVWTWADDARPSPDLCHPLPRIVASDLVPANVRTGIARTGSHGQPARLVRAFPILLARKSLTIARALWPGARERALIPSRPIHGPHLPTGWGQGVISRKKRGSRRKGPLHCGCGARVSWPVAVIPGEGGGGQTEFELVYFW
jgi:hypothetical protein